MSYPGPQPPHQPTPPHGYHPPTGGFPAAGPPPPYAGPPAPPKRGLPTGAIVGIVLGSIVVVCCIGALIIGAVNGDKQPAKQAADDQPASAAAAAGTGPAVATSGGAPAKTTGGAPAKTSDVAAAGSTVRDGKFEFKVAKGLECGKTSIGAQQAQGRFCQFTLSVKNIGNDARTFDDSNVVAYNAAGARFETDGVAGIYANPNAETFLNNINPGSQVSAVIVFDVAADVQLTTLELHDSLFSRGVKVALA